MYNQKQFTSIKVHLPHSLFQILDAKSKELQLPISRLAAYAIDNEIGSSNPFVYECAIPPNETGCVSYSNEASKLAGYLIQKPSGTGQDMLVLCRRDIGIANKSLFLHALRELFIAGIVKEVKPKRSWFNFSPRYKHIVLRNIPTEEIRKLKMRKIDRLETKLKELKEDT